MITRANSKVYDRSAVGARRRGTPAFNFNLPAVDTCPGKTKACLEGFDGSHACYATRGRYVWNRSSHAANLEASTSRVAIVEAVEDLPAGAWLRIHTSGDFYSADYIHAWRVALSLRPDVTAWCYTRSWSVTRLLPALERLRELANVQVFASVDPTSRKQPPAGWR